eukprot:SAG31_NODE_89_length_26711_cov_24.949459_25_plen_72_part_00
MDALNVGMLKACTLALQSKRLVKEGQQLFGNRQYRLAAERFAAAAQLDPDNGPLIEAIKLSEQMSNGSNQF